jgi:peptide/nickel transport system substrate-binding protein
MTIGGEGRMAQRLRALAVTGACLAFAAAAAGCGSSSSNGGGGAAAGGGTKSGAGDKTVVFAVNSLPDHMITVPWGGIASHVVLGGLGSQLTGYDTSGFDDGGCEVPPNTSNVKGNLAESIELSEDGKKVTVTLKELKSPAGNTLSAKDVKWSLDFVAETNPVALNGFAVAGYDTEPLSKMIKVVDERTVEFKVAKPSSFILEALQNNIQNIYDSTEVEKHATKKDPWGQVWLAQNVADYSGWELESFTPGSKLTLKANPDWGGERGNVTRLVVQSVPQSSTREQLITTGQADVVNGMEFDQYKNLESASGVEVIACNAFTRDTLNLNTKAKPFDDPRVREAVSLAIDRQALADGAYMGYAQPAKSPFPASLGFEEPEHTYAYDPERAKQLLAEAGHPNGFPLTITFSPTRPGLVARKSAVLIQSMLGDVGIKVKLREVASPTDFYEVHSKSRYQAELYGEPAVISDPSFFGYVSLSTTGPDNTTDWENPEYDKLIEQLRGTPSDQEAERKEILTKMADAAVQGHSVEYLVEVPNLVAVRDTVDRIVPLPNGQIRWTQLNKK